MDFDREFANLTGFAPLRWQQRLFADFFDKGEIPAALDLPTGLGKTSVMAIWLIARALSDDAARKKLPRRLVYVVDRRAVVDQATEVAEKIRAALDDGATVIKRGLGLAEKAKFPISTLRGQHADNREWLADPASPAIIVGTVDMIGSRLLFEGYGVSRKMRPYHAGLLGVDALVVLDEAHLVPPFAHLLRSIEQGAGDAAEIARHDHLGPQGEARRAVIPRFALLPLSATQRNIGALQARDSFHLTDADEDKITKKRLDAVKRLTLLEPGEGKKADEALAKKAFELATRNRDWRRVVVFCDRRDKNDDGSFATAQGIAEELGKLAQGDKKAGREKVAIDVQLMVGARRVKEREDVAKWLGEYGFSGEKKALDKPAILIATSAGEVGVDIDAEHMVCDLVAWERMVQRLGRVNRRGEGDAEVAVFWSKSTSKAKKKPAEVGSGVAGGDVDPCALVAANSKAVLECLPKFGDGVGRDASPRALRRLLETAQNNDALKDKIAAATTPEPLRPALNRALVDAWSMTSLQSHTGRPEVAPWLRGWIDDDKPRTTVVWRRHLPVQTGRASERLSKSDIKAIADFFEAAPPHQSEKLETETFRVVEWLCARAADADADKAESDADDVVEYNEGSLTENKTSLRPDEIVALTLTPAGDFAKAYSIRDLASRTDKKARDPLHREFAGKTVVVDARIGGLACGLLDAETDVAVPSIDGDSEAWAADFRVRRVEGEDNASDDGWRFEYEFALAESEDGSPPRLIVEHLRSDASNEDSRSVSIPQTLADHQSWAADKASAIAQSLALPENLAHALTTAARLHDEGKKAARWQRAFNAARDQRKLGLDGPLAKTCGPINHAILDGYRHEFGSLSYVEKDEVFRELPDDRKDLVLHLVAAHHGFARPLIETRSCDDAPPSALEERARDVALRFARLQKQWGPWGLAWLEALVRAADAQASRENDARAAKSGDA